MKSATAEASKVADDANQEFEIAKKAVIEAYSSFLEAKKHLKKAALVAGFEFKESANQYIEEAITKVRDKKDELSESTGAYVKENPLTTVSLAFLGGVIFSRIFGK